MSDRVTEFFKLRKNLEPNEALDPDSPLRVDTAHARDTLRRMVLARVPLEWFDSEDTMDYLIDHCGGHPRDLVRLLSLTWQKSRHNRLERADAEKAVASLASDFRRLLNTEDYALLRRIDQGDEDRAERPELVKLFQILALLEYNDHWWRSHPIVQGLPGYARDVGP
ncbi:MAG: hypothetical protein H7837_13580 [Magnetococcus sp. MYC-9]